LFHPAGGVSRAAFSPDGRMVLTGGTEGVARLWDVKTGKVLGPAPGREGVLAVAFSPDGRRLAAAGRHGRIALWDTPRPLEGDVERVRLWVEVLTGMELDSQDVVQPLSAEALERRRSRLEELG